jgi:hypothetical protein
MVFSPTTVTGTAVLEYGPTEILPQVGALSKHAERLCRPGRQASRAHPRGKPGFWTFESGCGRETDSLLEGDGFEPSVPRQKDNAFRDSSFPNMRARHRRLRKRSPHRPAAASSSCRSRSDERRTHSPLKACHLGTRKSADGRRLRRLRLHRCGRQPHRSSAVAGGPRGCRRDSSGMCLLAIPTLRRVQLVRRQPARPTSPHLNSRPSAA